MPPKSIIWQVQHDRNLWRDFPLELQNLVETEWQQWQDGGAADELVIDFVWPNKDGTKFTPYEIVFATGTMIQKRKDNGFEREVRRLECAA